MENTNNNCKIATCKIAAKVSIKILEKFSFKLAEKLVGLVPLAGAAANATVNAWFMDGIIKAAEEMYETKFKQMREKLDMNPNPIIAI